MEKRNEVTNKPRRSRTPKMVDFKMKQRTLKEVKPKATKRGRPRKQPIENHYSLQINENPTENLKDEIGIVLKGNKTFKTPKNYKINTHSALASRKDSSLELPYKKQKLNTNKSDNNDLTQDRSKSEVNLDFSDGKKQIRNRKKTSTKKNTIISNPNSLINYKDFTQSDQLNLTIDASLSQSISKSARSAKRKIGKQSLCPLGDFSQVKNEMHVVRQGHYTQGDKPLRIIKMHYDQEKSDIVFEMEWKKLEKQVTLESSAITRQELLKYDPLLLTYFYEKHLEFPHYPDFQCSNLTRIPHQMYS